MLNNQQHQHCNKKHQGSHNQNHNRNQNEYHKQNQYHNQLDHDQKHNYPSKDQNHKYDPPPPPPPSPSTPWYKWDYNSVITAELYVLDFVKSLDINSNENQI